MTEAVDTIVVGAGVAGLTAARALMRAGCEVVVLEKSRGLGGRAATRRVGKSVADHGAQYLTARNERLQAQLAAWQASGHVRVWSRGFHTLTAEGVCEAPTDGHPRYIFPAGMSTFGKLLAEGLTVRRETRVTRLVAEPKGWRLETDNHEAFCARRVIVNTPPRQALDLVAGVSLEAAVQGALERVAFVPCLALMAGYAPEYAPAWQGVTFEADDTLAWLAHDSSKRANASETVMVLHSTPAFAEAHYGDDHDAIRTRMLEAAAVLGAWLHEPRWTELRPWRYAMTTTPYQEPLLRHDDTLLFCGDWCGGAKLEAAYLSGLAVAETLLPS